MNQIILPPSALLPLLCVCSNAASSSCSLCDNKPLKIEKPFLPALKLLSSASIFQPFPFISWRLKVFNQMKNDCAIDQGKFNDLIRLESFRTDKQSNQMKKNCHNFIRTVEEKKFNFGNKNEFFFGWRKFFNHVRLNCDMCDGESSICSSNTT